MPRFNGIPAESTSASPRFKGVPVNQPQGGRHLSFEEGQRLLEEERLSGAGGEVGAGLSSFLEGFPVVGPAILGGAQRAAAGIASLIDGEDYATNLKQGQDITQTAQEQNPIVSTAGSIAGSVAGTAPLVAAAPAAFGVSGASLPARMLASGASGAALGAADGGVRDGAEGAMWGAGIGGALGVAGPAVGDVAGRVVRNVMNGRAQNEAARIAGTNRGSIDNVARVLAADNASGGTNANIAAAGPRAMLADAGDSTLGLLDTVIARGGPQAGTARQRINARAAGAADDITAAMDNALGPDAGIAAPIAQLRQQTGPVTHAAYHDPVRGAYAQPINYADPRGQALERMIRNRVPAGAIQKANDLMRINGEESQQILARIADDGTVTFEQMPDVRQIDYITRALRQTGQRGDGKGAMGGNTDEGRAYMNLASQMRNTLRSLVPEYGVALDTASDAIGRREAREFGRTFLNRNVPRDEVDDFVGGLSQIELQDLRSGLRSQIGETLANIKRTATDPNVDARQGLTALKEFSSDAARHKIRAILPQNEADAFIRQIDQAARSFEIRAGVASNSRTYGRQAGDRAIRQQAAPGFIEEAASGAPLKSAQSFFQNLMGTGPEAQLAREDAIAGELANLLTQPVNQGGGTFLQAMQRAAQQIPVSDRQAQAVTNAVTRGVALTAQPGRRLLQN